MPYYIRTAQPDDAQKLLRIYAPFVSDTCISFETEVPSVEDFAERIRSGVRDRAYIVAADTATDEIAGYAYNGSFRARHAYDWASEISIYLAPAHQGHGLGSIMLDVLEELMRIQGIRMSESCITSDNTGSIAFHERHGYRVCGEHTSCGYKLGRWLSVTWMEKQLLPLDETPAPPHAPDARAAAAIIAAANERLLGGSAGA